MNKKYDLETELRNALRRKQPSRDLMPNVPRPNRSWWKLPVAAMLAVSIGGGSAYRIYEQRQAKNQLVFALRFTAMKLQHTRTRMQTIQLERPQ